MPREFCGQPHELVVEHEEDGLSETGDPQEKGAHDLYEFRVRYIIRHPEGGCWPEEKCTCGLPDGVTELVLDTCPVHGQAASSRVPCPILEDIAQIGIGEALGIISYARRHGTWGYFTDHLEEGLYTVQPWSSHYSGPEGEDWDSGLEIEKVTTESKES